MAQPESNHSNAKADVTIRLTARHARSDFVVPERVITLTKASTTTQVGRASKQESKGFVAARENAWFDSPVMSRQHAELSADFETKTVLIQDIGSLHGTFHRTKDGTKEDRLPAREKVLLKDGDILRFGTDIYRGQLTFPPCTVHVELTWIEEQVSSSTLPPSCEVELTAISRTPHLAVSNRATPTNTFCVPDFDDDDDDDDDPTSDDDIMEIDKPLSAEIENATHTNVIDLTVGPSNVQLSSSLTTGRSDSNVIDLTSEPGSEDSLFMAEQPFSQFDAEDTATINGGYDYESNASSDPYVGGYTDSEDEIASGQASTGEVPTSPIKTSPISDRKVASINSYSLKYSPLYDSESDSEVEWNGDATISVHSDDDSSSDLGDADTVVENSCNNEEQANQSTDASSDHDYSTSDDIDEEDEENSGSELSRDLNNVPYWDEELSSSYSEEENEVDGLDTFDSHPMPLVDITSPSGSSLPVPTVSGALPPSSQFNTIPPRTICGTPAFTRGPTAPFIPVRPMQSIIIDSADGHVNQPSHLRTQNDRQPSPSDAVMAKTNPIQHATSSTAQLLGERTGKYEFFAARDHNRASVMSNPLIPKIPSTINTTNTPNFATNEPSTTDIDKPTDATATSTSASPQKGNVFFTEHFENSLSDKDDTNEPPAAQVRSPCPPWREPQLAKDTMTDIILESRYGVDQPPLVNSTWTPVGEAFLKEPNHCLVPVSDERTRLQSPDLDMTSAATFAESKKKTEADVSRSRRRLAVKFLLHESKETSPAPVGDSNDSPRPHKRSYDEVFSESEEQHIAESPSNNVAIPFAETDTVTTVMSGTDTPVPDNTAPVVASSEQIISDTPEVAPTVSTVIAASVQQLDSRPAKRRRFSKFAKYASVSVVSGFTSAALVFAGLAATAPQID